MFPPPAKHPQKNTCMLHVIEKSKGLHLSIWPRNSRDPQWWDPDSQTTPIRIPWSVGMVWEPSGNAGLTIEGLWGNPYKFVWVIYFQQCCLRPSTSLLHPFQYQETATSKSRVADTKPRTKSSRDDLAVNGGMELMGTPFLFLGVGWEFKIHVIEKTASNQLEITKSPCNESNPTVLKLCVAFVTVPTNNSLWVGRFGFFFKPSLDPLPPPKSSTKQCL